MIDWPELPIKASLPETRQTNVLYPEKIVCCILGLTLNFPRDLVAYLIGHLSLSHPSQILKKVLFLKNLKRRSLSWAQLSLSSASFRLLMSCVENFRRARRGWGRRVKVPKRARRGCEAKEKIGIYFHDMVIALKLQWTWRLFLSAKKENVHFLFVVYDP